jgi:hypothetical protein
MKAVAISIIGFALLKLAVGQTDIKQVFSIGDHFGGGIIFSLDPSGQHGLIAAPFDQINNTCWGDDGWIGASFVNEGTVNTKKIVTFMKTKQLFACKMPAACLCDSLTLGGYSDWYLPSINELKEMYENQKVIGGFVGWFYCSSTEVDKRHCFTVDFRPGRKKQIVNLPKIYKGYVVRCIRNSANEIPPIQENLKLNKNSAPEKSSDELILDKVQTTMNRKETKYHNITDVKSGDIVKFMSPYGDAIFGIIVERRGNNKVKIKTYPTAGFLLTVEEDLKNISKVELIN